MPHDVFLSHSSKDDAAAATVCAAMEQAGIRVWVAPRDIPPGQNWGASIIDAINSCRVMVLLFTSHSNGSQQVARELERAVAKRVQIIPVRLEAVEPSGATEYYLGTTQWLDAFRPSLDSNLGMLTRAVRELLDQSPGVRRPLAAAPRRPATGASPVRRLVVGAALLAVLVSGVLAVRLVVSHWRMTHLAADLQARFAEVREAELQNRKPDPGPVQAAIHKLLELDPANGHALYFSGELSRLLHQELFTPKGCLRPDSAAEGADLSPYENDFYRYLDNARSLPAAETGGDTGVGICYARRSGYCPQRTAWVDHLLSLDLLGQAAASADPAVRKEKLTESLSHAQEALKLYPPHGFDQCLPTEAVIAKVTAALGAPPP